MREKAFAYDGDGFPQSPTVQPNDVALKLATRYARVTRLGVTKKQTQTWRDPIGPTRRSRATRSP